MNVIVWLEFELTHFEATVQHFSPYATGTPWHLCDISHNANSVCVNLQ